MSKAFKYIGQGVVYALIAVVLGYFSNAPVYRHFADDDAQLTLSLALTGKHVRECRRRTSAEIAALAPNMRKPLDCPRERVPVLIEVVLDGRTIFRRSTPPSGLFGDGPAQIYENFTIPSGVHDLAVRLRDSTRSEGFDYQRKARIEFGPRQRFVIEFRSEAGGFIFAKAARPGGAGTEG